MTSLVSALADRANALVVLELRRGIRARVFAVAFTLVLAACVVIALSAYAGYEPGGDAGRVAFVAFYACLAAAAFFILPYSAYRSLSREREEHTWPLVVLTRMKPRQILAGKIGSYLVQSVLYASAVAPFLLFSYLLQGIDLITVGVLVVASGGFHLFLTVAAASAATLAEGRLWRGIIHLAVLGALGWASIMSVIFAGVLVEGSTSPVSDPDFQAGMGFAAWMAISFCLLLFAVGVSKLTFESDNHVLWPRLALLLQFAGTVVAAGLAAWIERDGDLGGVLALLGCVLAWTAGLFGATGPAGLSRRLAQGRKLPLLMPGAASGMLFHALLASAYSVAGAAIVVGFGFDEDVLVVALGCGAFAVLYLSLPLALGRGPLRRMLPSPAHLRVFTFVFLGISWGLPVLMAAVLGLDSEEAELLNFFNPPIALEALHDDQDPARLIILGAVAAVCLLSALLVSAARDREANGG